MCAGRFSVLHYGPLTETNNLYAPSPNGKVGVSFNKCKESENYISMKITWFTVTLP